MCLNANFIPEQQPSVGTVRPTAPLCTAAALFIAVVHLAVNYAWSEGHHHHHHRRGHRQRHHRSACGWPSFIFAKAADRWVHKGRCCTVLCTRLVDVAAVGEVFVIVFLIAESVRLCLSRALGIIISSIKTHTPTHTEKEKTREKKRDGERKVMPSIVNGWRMPLRQLLRPAFSCLSHDSVMPWAETWTNMSQKKEFQQKKQHKKPNWNLQLSGGKK